MSLCPKCKMGIMTVQPKMSYGEPPTYSCSHCNYEYTLTPYYERNKK